MANSSQARTGLGRTLAVCAILFVILVFVFLISSIVGSQRLPIAGTFCALTGKSDCALTGEERAILLDIRIPRLLLAGAVGTCLAAAGAAYQALLRNPLAEPYLLGISNGAAVGTMMALVFFGAHEWSRPVLAFAGALLATIFVYQLGRGRAGTTPERLILAGIIVRNFLSSAIVFLTALMDATRIRSFTFWLLGDLSGATTSLLALTFVVGLLGVALLAAHARPLNLMMLGERDAFDLGVETSRVRITVFVAASLLVGASVASSGSVGYVGLVVPHLVRLSFGGDNRLVIVAAALAGAAFVIVADTVARTIIAPPELPVGAVPAFIGAPLLILLPPEGSSVARGQ